jgi:hypothetical protein
MNASQHLSDQVVPPVNYSAAGVWPNEYGLAILAFGGWMSGGKRFYGFPVDSRLITSGHQRMPLLGLRKEYRVSPESTLMRFLAGEQFDTS